MPSKRLGVYDVGQNILTTPKHQVGKLSAIQIDQRDAQTKITVVDMYSGDVSAGVASPTVNSGVILEVTVNSGEVISYNEDELKDKRIFGIASLYGSASRNITCVFDYHFE